MEKNLLEQVKAAGIVGAGGAGFPTHGKLGTKAELVVVNGAECEPLLRVDQQLMYLEADKLLKGLSLVVDFLGAKKGMIALKEKYHKAFDALCGRVKEYKNLELKLLDNFYPAGDEQVLVYETTGRIVPEGGIPLNVGVVVMNVETLINLCDAYYDDTPVIRKYVTVTGEVPQKKTVKVPVGVSVREVVRMAGLELTDNHVVINGGPMMGKVIAAESPITKTVKGLIVLMKGHRLLESLNRDACHVLKNAKTACMDCSLCTEVCPRFMLGHRLEPHKLMRVASYGGVYDSTSSIENAFLCCGCRMCEYACVQDLQPWNINGILKGKLSQAGVKNSLHDQPEKVRPFREYRKYPVKRLIEKLGLTKYDVDAPVEDAPIDFKTVRLELRQHIGAPSEPVCSKGDTVKEGDLIAKIPEGSLGANLHASVSGKVVEVTETYIRLEKN